MFEHFAQIEAFFQQRKRYGVKPGLERMNKLLKLLGEPQAGIKAVHVAGTNGKGSTIHYLKQSLMLNGYRVGVFNSPSLEGLTGHLFINDSKIPEETMLFYMNQIYPLIKDLDAEFSHPTEFEILTAIAFLYFADNTDIALIEAGMGGREDTTNCFKPLVSIITNVDWDHMNFLGESLDSIANHKAGIIKEKKPVITGEIREPAQSVIVGEALRKNAPFYFINEAFWFKIIEKTDSYQSFQWKAASGLTRQITLKSPATHQVKNASLAVMALVILEEKGFSLDWETIIGGWRTLYIPGRFEQIHTQPIIILDGAHNPAGVHAFTNTLTDIYPNEEKHLIFAAFKDKDLYKMLGSLEPHFSSITLTTFDHPRAAGIDYLQSFSSHSNTLCFSDWRYAIEQIRFEGLNRCYCITGSLHFIQIVRKYFEEIIEV